MRIPLRHTLAALLTTASAFGQAAEFEFPTTLSETGFYISTANKQIAADFHAYAINSPLWTDGATKDRFVRLPPGAKMTFRADGEWGFPSGTTFLQTIYFADGDARVYTETRVIVREGDELHFASYMWDDEGEDAELVGEFGDDFYANHGDVSQLWSVAPREDCRQCHDERAAGHTLGLTTAQLNRPAAGGGLNQIRLFRDRGILDAAPADDGLAALPALTDPHDSEAPLEHRVRSYLATNCATCHTPGGEGPGSLDLRIEVPLAETGLLRRGMVSARSPDRSRILRRMATVEQGRMPNLLSTVPDDEGMRMIRDWIAGIDRDGR